MNDVIGDRTTLIPLFIEAEFLTKTLRIDDDDPISNWLEFTGDTNDAVERLAKIKTANDDDDDNWKSIEKLKNQIKTYNGEDLPADEDTKDSVSRNESLSLCKSKNAPAVSNGFKLQTAFQPNYTSIHLEDRYLVWNGVGIVTSCADGANGAIDVKFHDASVHHSLHILNYNNHNMASLSCTALVLAVEDSAKLVVIALAASGNKEWSMQLSEEDVVAVVATSKLIACKNITFALTPDRQLVRQGFSDCGSPVFEDSVGLVQLFNVKTGFCTDTQLWAIDGRRIIETESIINNWELLCTEVSIYLLFLSLTDVIIALSFLLEES
ncbi:hypothetical protein GQX74_005726 [Glossina fuscipes]|nr:hypothetical protein GQX74_005726 [Glossina fuscipes]